MQLYDPQSTAEWSAFRDSDANERMQEHVAEERRNQWRKSVNENEPPLGAEDRGLVGI